MPRYRLIKILLASILFLGAQNWAAAQFRDEAFSKGNYGNDATEAADSVQQMFSLKEFMLGVTHKQELKIGTLFGGSAVFIGAQQYYHRQYWKIPISYAGIGAGIGAGINAKKNGDDKMANLFFAGAGLVYWGTLMDGVLQYDKGQGHNPGKATIFSILLPGLGQAYNGEAWKIPIYLGGLMGAYHFYDTNNINYKRYKRIHNEATTPDSGYSESISAETAKYYRDIYRRYRDYSTVAIAAFYLLQVIDANVFAYMQDFEVNDDISMHIRPTVITPGTDFAFCSTGPSGLGLSLGFSF
ncbi:MAG: DUF5683 domain-containing protein [Bacteroidales bacterium]|nr:DUF5683 domain-containing protein [Bacteroidales bacterium]